MAKRTPRSAALTEKTRIAVLYGPEEMVKRTRLEELRSALAAAHGEVDTHTFDGKSASLADVFDELRSFSLMQAFKLVIVDEADQFVKTHRAALERYAENPVDHATLLLRAGTWNKGNLDKLIEQHGAIVKCEPLKPAEAQAELIRRAQAEHNRRLQPRAAGLLVERLGTDLLTLDTELAKLSLMVEEGQAIEPALVEQTVGQSSDEQAYVVQEAVLEALLNGSCGETICKVHELVDLAGQADILVTYFVADLVRKLNVATMARRAGVPEAAVAKQVKVWGPRQRPFFEAVRRIDEGRIGRLFDQVVEADARSKSGLGEAMRNLECFCVHLADGKGRSAAVPRRM